MPAEQSFSQTSSDQPFVKPVELNRQGDFAADKQTTISDAVSSYVDDWIRVAYFMLAGVFFVAGVLGALLPVLPATPFLLLASYFLSKSSPRLNRALLRSRLFGPILRDWQELGGIRRSVRIKAIVAVVLAVAVTLFVSELSAAAMLAVVILALVGIVVVLRLPSAVENDAGNLADRRA